MSKKKKTNKPADQEDSAIKKEIEDGVSDGSVDESTEDSQAEKKEKKKKKKEDAEPRPIISGKSAVKGIFASFGILAVLFLWSAFASVQTNSFILPMLLGLAIGGFLVAFLTKQLTQSAYYNLYRILSLLLFLPIVVINFYRFNMNGFSFGFFGILSASVLVAAIIPYLFEGMDIDGIALYSISIFFALALIYLTYSSSILNSGEKTLYKAHIFPAGVVFSKDSKTTWIYGDNKVLTGEPKAPLAFRIATDRHPEVFMELNRLQKDEMVKAMGNNPKGKQKPADVKNGSPAPSASPSISPSPSPSQEAVDKAAEEKKDTEFPAFELKGEEFSSCQDRAGEKIAVAGSKLEETGNSVVVITLPDFKKIKILENSDLKPFLPGLAMNYPGYTPWNESGNRFFFFTYGEGGSLRLFVGDTDKESNTEIKLENILSACWVSNDELRIVTGTREPVKHFDLLNVFNFDIQGGAVYKWKEGTENPEKIADMDAGVKRVVVHPLKGKIFTFDGQNMGVLAADSSEFEKKNLNVIPGAFDSILSPDGKQLACRDGQKICVVDLETTVVRDLSSTRNKTGNFTFTGDNRYLLWTDVFPGSVIFYNSNIVVYDLQKNASVKYPINFKMCAYFSNISTNMPYGPNKMGYIYDPYNNGVYYEQVSNENVMSLWKAYRLYNGMESGK